MKMIYTVMFLFISIGCAGPTSPFGSNVFISNNFEINSDMPNLTESKIKVTTQPERKIFHSNFDLKIKVSNPYGFKPNFKYQIVYNGHILNRWWKQELIELNKTHTEATITFKNISLLPGLRNDIKFLYYESDSSPPIVYEFGGPECRIDRFHEIAETTPFSLKESFIEILESTSKKQKINPTLLAALVAQESSFNAKALSINKALGLTQVTPLADIDIRLQKPEWSSYPEYHKLSYLDLKYKVYKGVINAKNDWRLDKTKSVEGGAVYLNQLLSYWSADYNQNFLKDHFKTVPMTDIILASYNSGPTRVKRNIKKYNKEWIWSNELKEARKYVMNIKSYCYKFKR